MTFKIFNNWPCFVIDPQNRSKRECSGSPLLVLTLTRKLLDHGEVQGLQKGGEEEVAKSLLFPGGSGQHLLTNRNISTIISHSSAYQVNSSPVLGAGYSFFPLSQLYYSIWTRFSDSLSPLVVGWLPVAPRAACFLLHIQQRGVRPFPPAALAYIPRFALMGLAEIICPILIDQRGWQGRGWNGRLA